MCYVKSVLISRCLLVMNGENGDFEIVLSIGETPDYGLWYNTIVLVIGNFFVKYSSICETNVKTEFSENSNRKKQQNDCIETLYLVCTVL